jgi:hypothetical protein
MHLRQRTLAFLAVGAAVLAAGCARAPERLTPEAASAKGDALLREMSKNLAALQTFAYTADERREVVQGAAKTERHISRRVTVRRPNAIAFTQTGDNTDGGGWYDGKHLTVYSNKDKVWARGPVPPTIDEALDYLSAEYAMQMPTADLLYTSPYDAFMTKDTTGGWVDAQKIGDRNCDHLAYKQPAVDWELWVNEANRLPCQARITYKNAPGQPVTTVTYNNFDKAPQLTDDTFAAKVPDGYQRIKIMRHATVADATVEEATPAPADPKKK